MERQQQDVDALLELCSTLTADSSKSPIAIQKRVNAYLEEQAECESAFVILRDDSQRRRQPTIQAEPDDDGVSRNAAHHFPENSHPLPGKDSALFSVGVVGQSERSPAARIENMTSLSTPSHLRDMPYPEETARFVENIVETAVHSALIVPSSSKGTAVAAVCLVNKRGGGGQFDGADERVASTCLRVVGGILSSALALEEETRLRRQCQSLLTVAKNLFSHLDDVPVLLRQIMSEARQLTSAERCSLFLVDDKNQELVAKVFDGRLATPERQRGGSGGGGGGGDRRGKESGYDEIRVPMDEGIAGHVAKTGALLNIPDAQSHPLFYRNIDQITGFTTRNILCFPIKQADGKTIGVAELCNKSSGEGHFTLFDQEVAGAFSTYCGISIIHSLMYKKVVDAQHRSKLSNELMMYHMKVLDDDVVRLVAMNLPSVCRAYEERITQFSFSPRVIPQDETPAVILSLMQRMGFIERFRISRETLARFVLMVRRGYRDPPYHNWTHAFTVAHFAFLLIDGLDLLGRGVVSDLEALALFLACLCHDLDHRGTNNTFQVASNSVLAALYSSEGSVMERHHFAQTMCILNTDGCNVLETLPEGGYMRCLDLLRDIILATDLAHHLRIRADLEGMVSAGYDASNADHKALLLSLMMTACDLSDQTKDWANTKETAELIYSEFFGQGDLEKAMGNKPQVMMDRERAYIPRLQIEFIDLITLPVYRDLSRLFPSSPSPYLDAVERNRLGWTFVDEALERRGRNGSTSSVRDIFRDSSVDREVAEKTAEHAKS